MIDVVGVTLREVGTVVDVPAKPRIKKLPAVPPVCVKLELDAAILDGLSTEVPVAEISIMLPAIFPAPLLVALVSIPPAVIAVEPVPPLEINTEPPRAEVLDPFAVALAEIEDDKLTAPLPTIETGPALPFKPVASVLIAPVTDTFVPEVVTAELASNTSPPSLPEVFTDPTVRVAALPVLPVAATRYPPLPVVPDKSTLPSEMPFVYTTLRFPPETPAAVIPVVVTEPLEANKAIEPP